MTARLTRSKTGSLKKTQAETISGLTNTSYSSRNKIKKPAANPLQSSNKLFKLKIETNLQNLKPAYRSKPANKSTTLITKIQNLEKSMDNSVLSTDPFIMTHISRLAKYKQLKNFSISIGLLRLLKQEYEDPQTELSKIVDSDDKSFYQMYGVELDEHEFPSFN